MWEHKHGSETMEGDAVKLRSIIADLLAHLPLERTDLTTGRCAGCGVIHWCGDGLGREPCRPGCIIQKAKFAIRVAQ